MELQVAEGGDVEPVLAIEAAGCDPYLPVGTDIRLVGLIADGVVGEPDYPLH
jgi:hypothetical protein